MKLEPIQGDTVDLSFEIPQAGESILQFVEGIQKRTNENSGKTTLQLPLIIDKVLEGPESNEGLKLSHFCPIESDWGERQLAGILTLTGLVNSFAGKFGNEVDVTSEKFINALKLKLPGKFIKCAHEVRKDNSGKDRCNIVKFEKMNSAGKPAQGKGKGESGGEGGSNDSDW
jgi:hypothetical protein